MKPEEVFGQKSKDNSDIRPANFDRIKQELHDGGHCSAQVSPLRANDLEPSTNSAASSTIATRSSGIACDATGERCGLLSVHKLLDILSMNREDDCTGMALDSIMQYATLSAARDDEYGISWIESFISRLEENCTDGDWLAKVVSLLQHRLQASFDQLQSRISSLGKASLSVSKAQPWAADHSTVAGFEGHESMVVLKPNTSEPTSLQDDLLTALGHTDCSGANRNNAFDCNGEEPRPTSSSADQLHGGLSSLISPSVAPPAKQRVPEGQLEQLSKLRRSNNRSCLRGRLICVYRQ